MHIDVLSIFIVIIIIMIVFIYRAHHIMIKMLYVLE